MSDHTVIDHELWIESVKGFEHMLLVSFSYQLVDYGIGWNEWCGIWAYDTNIAPEIVINKVSVVSTSGTKRRNVAITDQFRGLIISRLEEEYDFTEED